MAIDKITAGTLYSYGYKLKDSEGNVWDINSIIGETHFYGWHGDISKNIFFDQIGTTYKILARPLEQLTKEIDGKVPLIELATIESAPFEITEFKDTYVNNFNNVFWVDYYDEEEIENRFCFCKGNFQKGFVENTSHYIVENQLSLFQYLYSLNFNIGFPENTTTNLI